MRFSVWPNLMQPAVDVLAVARHADDTGWDGVWVADHFMGDGGGFGAPEDPTLEATAVVAALATATRRVRIGPLVLGATYRHPAVVAKWAATVDHLSATASAAPGGAGRLVLGLGAGWQRNEHEQYGIDLPPVRARVDRFREYCAAVTSLLSQPTSDLDGEWFQLTGALSEPKAAAGPDRSAIPVLIGGKGDRMLRIAARYADEWNMWGLPELIAERSAALDRACEAIDRDPAAITRSTQALLLPTDDEAAARRFLEAVAPRAAVAGPIGRIVDVVAAWRDVGVTEVIVPDSPLGRGAERIDRLDALAEAFAPFRT
ncbi:LLM class flavin-dependent oxidoreductase [Dermatobacter hominis]|uniref:LLM class flavin-dependent oxidoreductase n=1 Tax=Dermatobacter hominis TaxID=2884263 RepID=UPI001D121281|nr:LLM class flavin-dependent oxidoreductase [Dermatobacter hominis]UDY36542.1 LLM class flavin-dependent oxidoreductase [Dermatobacter hominis]